MTFPSNCETTATLLQAFADQARQRQAPAIRQLPMAELAHRLDCARLITEGGLDGERLRTFLVEYLAHATRLQHPGTMAHQVAMPHPTGAVAALVDSFTNNAMAIYEMGPPAATVEFVLLNWMLAKVGWRPAPFPGTPALPEGHGAGVLTHGGSLANLTALQAARAHIAPDAWLNGTPANLVIIAAEGCHYSFARAAGILGLGLKALRHAPTDAEGRLDPDRLGEFITEVRAEGSQVMCVVANACATATGLYDPLREVALVCREHGVWLHVDGAHGASALVSERQRALLDGVELADSLIWDAHKMLRAPTVCAAVLVRDQRTLDNAFREEASYLFHDKDQPGIDLVHRTVECTKAALGLKAFFVLAAEGEQAIARFIDRQVELAKAAAAALRAEAGFEVAVEPQSNIVCFRLDGDDALQLELRRRLTEAGNHYISTTAFRGRRWLRLALMNPDSEMADISALIAELRRSRFS